MAGCAGGGNHRFAVKKSINFLPNVLKSNKTGNVDLLPPLRLIDYHQRQWRGRIAMQETADRGITVDPSELIAGMQHPDAGADPQGGSEPQRCAAEPPRQRDQEDRGHDTETDQKWWRQF